jgi:hypothetical protein
VTDEKTEQRHGGFKEAEDDGDADSETPINSRQADTDGCGEVR